MEISSYLNKMKDIQEKLLAFLDSPNDIENEFQAFKKYLEEQNIIGEYFKDFLRLLNKISLNHHKNPNFHAKIDQILLSFKDNLKQQFTNCNLLNFFIKNMRILLFLIEEKILIIDQYAYFKLSSYDNNDDGKCYLKYFEPEVISYFTQQPMNNTQTFPDSFKENRKVGENDNFVCKLIQNDSIDEYINYSTQHKLKPSAKIKPSIFETNDFLQGKKINLIEYAAFKGSIQIFKELTQGKQNIDQSIWYYAIQGQNIEIIHLLEEMKIKPKSYVYLFNESIKCFHNDIAEYIKDNYLQNTEINTSDYAFLLFNNYNYLPDSYESESIFINLCQLDYFNIVKIILSKEHSIDINKRVFFNF